MKRVAAILAGVMLLMGIGNTAQALPMSLTVTDGIMTRTVVDGEATDADPTSGVISFYNLVLGTYSITVNSATGVGHPFLLWPEALHLNGVELKSTTTGGFLQFILTDSSLSLPQLDPTVSPNAVATYSINAFTQNGNTITNTILYNDKELGDLSGTAAGGLGFNATGTTYFDLINPFTLSEIVTINFGSTRGMSSFDAGVSIIPTPEPGTMVLLGAGFLGLAIYCKRRKNI